MMVICQSCRALYKNTRSTPLVASTLSGLHCTEVIMEFGVSFLVGLLAFVSFGHCFDGVYPPVYPLYPTESDYTSSTGDAYPPPADYPPQYDFPPESVYPPPPEFPTASEESHEPSETYVSPDVVFPPGFSADDPLGQLWQLAWNKLQSIERQAESVEAYRDNMILKVNKLSYKVFAWGRCKKNVLGHVAYVNSNSNSI